MGSQPEENTVVLDIGAKLAEAREAAGWSVADIAEKLLLKREIINQLEANEFDKQRSLIFTKGYLKSYAREVGLDVDELINAFDAQRQELSPVPKKMISFSKKERIKESNKKWWYTTYLVIVIIFSLLVIWWYQQPSDMELVVEPVVTESAQPELEDVTQLRDDAAVNKVVMQPDNATEEQAQTPTTSSLPPADMETDTDGGSEDLPALPAAQAVDAESDINRVINALEQDQMDQTLATVVTAEQVDVSFVFAADCWVQIFDATGNEIALGTKQAGRVMDIQGYPPFSVTLGVPSAVTIIYAGETLDTSFLPTNRSANLQLPLEN